MARYAALALLALSAVLRADTLIMKSGEKYQLKAPATHKNGRVTFTTTANRFLSVSESEVAREITGPPPAPPKQINRTDSRQLGAIARQQREERGQSAPVAGKSAEKKTPEEHPAKKSTGSKKNKKTPPDSPPPPPAEEDR